MKFKLFFLTVVFAPVTFVAKANTKFVNTGITTISKTDIAGGVIHADTKKPLGNVSVTVYSATKKEKVVYTDANGNYSFDELKAGTYKFIFEKEGFKKVIKDKVIIRPDEGCQLNVEMDNEASFEIVPGALFDFG